MANDKTKEVLYGLYDDETELLTAVHKAREEHMDIMDVFTPFPVHGLDEAMGLAEPPAYRGFRVRRHRHADRFLVHDLGFYA